MPVKDEPVSPGMDSPGSAEGFEDDVSLSPASPRAEEGGTGAPGVPGAAAGGAAPGERAASASGASAEDEDDDDRYEDALDLDTSRANAKMWMVRMPRFLLDRFTAGDMRGQKIGKLRIWKRPANVSATHPQKVRLILNDAPEVADLPHNYDLRLVNQVVDNVYVLKETDLPKRRRANGAAAGGNGGTSGSGSGSGGSGSSGAASSGTGGSEGSAGAAAGSVAPSAPRTYGAPDNAADAYDRYQPPARVVPKRTALVGQALHEVVATPDFKDPNYSNVLQARRGMEQPDAARQVTLLSDTAGVGGAKYGATLRSQRRTWAAAQRKRESARNSDGKAIRIPQNELLDKLFQLFKEYEYWTLKGLRERTRQPEVYLRQVVDLVAMRYRRGPYTGKYGLKFEYKKLIDQGVDPREVAADAPEVGAAGGDMDEDDDVGGGDDDDDDVDDDDDDDDEMETVL